MIQQTDCLTTPNTRKEACLLASATVEAALVIPIFLYAALAIIYILQIAAIKEGMQTSLYAGVRKLAGMAYAGELLLEQTAGTSTKAPSSMTENTSATEKSSISITADSYIAEGISLAAAWSIITGELDNHSGLTEHIVGGKAGIILLESSICENSSLIDLKVQYVVKNPFDIFGIGTVVIQQRCKTDAWLGEEKDGYQWQGGNEEQSVYVTAQGEVYHVDKNCTYLSRTVFQKRKEELAGLTNAENGTYYPCERCGKKENYQNVIYVTSYGDRYHTDLRCTQLARNILTIPLSQVGGRSCCQKCGGGK